MTGFLAAFTLVVLTSAGGTTDTTVTVRAGERLTLTNIMGDIAVEAWTRDAVRIVAEHDRQVEIEVRRLGPTLEIHPSYRRGGEVTIEYRLSVPRWMALELGGVESDIAVLGSEAEVKAESVNGEVSVTGPARSVSANSIEGEVRVTGARGRVECSSVNGSVRVEKARGPVSATSVNGEIELEALESASVAASSVNGTVEFSGTLQPSGSYRFSTHNGDIAMTIPEGANATLRVATYQGEFSSAFPVRLTETRRDKSFGFTLGDGSAKVELESFQGEIRLRRPGRK